MKIVCIGGGPGGLYFAISMKLKNPKVDITVIERNKAADTFGWGVVLSDETLDNLNKNDPVSAKKIRSNFAYWDDIAVFYKDKKLKSSGHGFCGIGRKLLLIILQDRAKELGVNLKFESEVGNISEYKKFNRARKFINYLQHRYTFYLNTFKIKNFNSKKSGN